MGTTVRVAALFVMPKALLTTTLYWPAWFIATALTAKWVAERQVRALHHNLEELVSRRTAELVRTNEQLRREVEHRKQAQKELQESLGRLTGIIGGTVMAIAAMDTLFRNGS